MKFEVAPLMNVEVTPFDRTKATMPPELTTAPLALPPESTVSWSPAPTTNPEILPPEATSISANAPSCSVTPSMTFDVALSKPSLAPDETTRPLTKPLTPITEPEATPPESISSSAPLPTIVS